MHPFLIVSVQWYVMLWSKRCVFSSRGLHQCTAWPLTLDQTLSSWVKRKHTCWFAWSSCNQLLLTSRIFLDDQLHVVGSTLTTKHTDESFQLEHVESNQTLFIRPLQCYLVISKGAVVLFPCHHQIMDQTWTWGLFQGRFFARNSLGKFALL